MFESENVFHDQYENQIHVAFINRLKKLEVTARCQIEGWETRIADYVADGTTVFLTDWEPVQINDSWDGNTVYFRATAVIPTEMAGKQVYLDIDLDGECLLYVNGKIIQSLDVHRKRARLTDNAAAGEIFEILVEATYRWQTFAHMRQKRIDIPPMIFKRGDLITVNDEISDFIWKMDHIFAMALKSQYTNRTVTNLLNEILIIVKPDEAAEQVILQIRKANELIDTLFNKHLEKKGFVVNAASHSHIDVAYLWPVKETVRKCARTFSNMLRLMEQYPDFKFTQGQPLLYKYTKTYYPELYAQIKERVKEGRWEVIGGMWVEPDGNIPSGESFIRQFLYGNKFIKDEFGFDSHICMLPDTFGMNASLPQIMVKSGMKYFHTFKLNTSRFNPFPHHIFWWEGIDGTKILSELDQFGSYEGSMQLDEIKKGVQKAAERDFAFERALYLYGYGDGGGGAVSSMVKDAEFHNSNPSAPKIRFSTVAEHVEQIENEIIERNLNVPSWYGDLYLEWHQGIFTSQAFVKQMNRQCEFEFMTAEMLGVFAGECGKSDFDKLHKGWEYILINQFHDILPGSSLKETYDNTRKELTQALQIASGLREKYMNKIICNDSEYITIFNCLSFPVDQLIELNQTDISLIDLETQEESLSFETADKTQFALKAVPALGYKTYKIKKRANNITKGQSLIKQVENTFIIENEHFIAEISTISGNLIRLFHKETACEALLKDGANLIFYQEAFDYGEAWNIKKTTLTTGRKITEASSVEIAENTPLCAKIKICRQFGNSSMEQIIKIEKYNPRVDFVTVIDWNESFKMLKAEFEVPVYSAYADYDIPYGNIHLFTKDKTSWDKARYEMCAHKWADLSDNRFGVAVLSDCKYGYIVKDNKLSITLLKAPSYPDKTCDKCRHSFTYSLLAHKGSFREGEVDKQGYLLNLAPIVKSGRNTAANSCRFMEIDADGVYLGCLKYAEDGSEDVMIRLYENFGSSKTVNVSIKQNFCQAFECDMNETVLGKIPLNGNTMLLKLEPYEIKTIRIKRK